VLCVVALSLAYPLRNYLDQKTALAAAVAEQRALEQQLAELQLQQAALSDPDYLRQEAKKRLQYVLPGDTVYVVQAPLPAADDATATAPAESGPWYTVLWDTLAAPAGSAVDPAAVTPTPVPPADGAGTTPGGVDGTTTAESPTTAPVAPTS